MIEIFEDRAPANFECPESTQTCIRPTCDECVSTRNRQMSAPETMPEEILAYDPDNHETPEGFWWIGDHKINGAVKYIRADLVEKRIIEAYCKGRTTPPDHIGDANNMVDE